MSEPMYNKEDVIRWQKAKTRQLCRESEALEKLYYATHCPTSGRLLKKYQNQTQDTHELKSEYPWNQVGSF